MSLCKSVLIGDIEPELFFFCNQEGMIDFDSISFFKSWRMGGQLTWRKWSIVAIDFVLRIFLFQLIFIPGIILYKTPCLNTFYTTSVEAAVV